jgi:hypothetical protein
MARQHRAPGRGCGLIVSFEGAFAVKSAAIPAKWGVYARELPPSTALQGESADHGISRQSASLSSAWIVATCGQGGGQAGGGPPRTHPSGAGPKPPASSRRIRPAPGGLPWLGRRKLSAAGIIRLQATSAPLSGGRRGVGRKAWRDSGACQRGHPANLLAGQGVQRGGRCAGARSTVEEGGPKGGAIVERT